MNILFIMYDQLRFDYLSCAGHPHLHTPNFDRVAARGVRFTNAYVQSPICGASRMSFYTGRYVASHGSTWNQVPLSVGEWTIGDHLRPLGVDVALAGKTHMVADLEGMARLGISPTDGDGVTLAQCGFNAHIRDDGLHPDSSVNPDLAYNRYLNAQGYAGDNPWHDWANSAEGPLGEILSGWYWRHSNLPARVRAEHSETPWMTDQALDYIRGRGDAPWCLHLSYIKPHWPYMAPAPYHALYGPDDVKPANRTDTERQDPHPVVGAFMDHDEGRTYARPEARDTIIPAYMGLIRQLDDEIGRLMAELDRLGRLDDTLIVLTSDHGDYLGDHWLGEKELFHDESVKIPLIIRHPDNAGGRVCDALVEAIDLLPTFVDGLGGCLPDTRLEGRSLLPFISGHPPEEWRDTAVSELDYSHRRARRVLNQPKARCRAWMLRDRDWKYIHYQGFRPQLFHMREDPAEQQDLAGHPEHQDRIREFGERLFTWLACDRKLRVTLDDAAVELRTDSWKKKGVIFGEW